MIKQLIWKAGAAFIICITLLTHAKAADPTSRDFGLGLVLGSPTGITAKYWLNKRSAVDASVGFGDLSVQADYLWHNWSIFPTVSQGAVAGYVGLGVRFEDDDDDNYHHRHNNGVDHDHDGDGDGEVGIRVPFGATYFFAEAPFELFLELVPVLEFGSGHDDTDLDLDAGLGARFYFGMANRK